MSNLDEKRLDSQEIRRLIFERQERLKELTAINQTTSILKEGKPTGETLQQVCMIVPAAWQYPDYTAARILYDGKEFKTYNFRETEWILRQTFQTTDGREGSFEVCYLQEFDECDEGPFLKEERHLINNLANLVTGYLNSVLAQDLLRETGQKAAIPAAKPAEEEEGRWQLLRKFLNKNNADRDIYHDLMPFRVKEILLIANLYDAYSIEKEGRFSEHVFGEYHSLNLTSIPRITGATSEEEALEQLNAKHYDLVIFMVGVDKNTPLEIGRTIKEQFPYIPVFMLLNSNSDLEFFTNEMRQESFIDRIFVWNGESKVFFAMINYIEDKINVQNDTAKGMVRVILLVEDSARFYSRYLPMLYSIVLEQTRQVIGEVATDELYKVLRMKARPKVLLATSYEEAVGIIGRYQENLLCLISDVKFEKEGVLDENAGVSLVRKLKEENRDIPVVLQSSDMENERRAFELQATFINKNSDSLLQDLKSFISHHLGFGNFVYRDENGLQIAVARNLKEFESNLRTIPEASLIYHAKRGHFSQWLMGRGEVFAANVLRVMNPDEFKSAKILREFMINAIQKYRNEQNRGKVIPFEESAVLDESNVVSLSPGYLGGKGRGLAFINALIYNFDFSQYLPNINIRAPKTSIIGTDEFEYFMERNKLLDQVINETDENVIKRKFLEGKLTEGLIKKLRIILKMINKPLAVRSSGLFEDSLNQPFAGIFETYLLPNSHPDPLMRLQQLMDAVRLVYASVYSSVARGYIQAINYKIEEEKMAVVIQEVVGNQYENVFYPHFSGVAQSYNYYPFSHMKPEEGFAVAAVGLGKHVVEGKKAHRFSPKYPDVEINSPKDQFKNSQVDFFAVDLDKKDLNLLEGDTAGLVELELSDAERHGTLQHMASVYDPDGGRIIPGLTQPGPRIVNFADILKYNYIPLAKTLETILDIGKEALGSPVEIEFAVDLNRDENYKASLYLLQIKPLIGNATDFNVNMDEIRSEQILLYSEKGMGNGLIDTIRDVIYIDNELFDKSRTPEMALEIEQLNTGMEKAGTRYILIGPGRWGTRDRFIGIPVNWPQISYAKVIVETSLEGFPLDASSGSHFFHNVTSMNVGYLSVQHEGLDSFISWDVLGDQELVEKTAFFRHVRFRDPLIVRMDGKKRISVVTWK